MPESSIQHRTAKTWEKIVIETDSRMTEAVAAYLADLSNSGIEISPSDEDGKRHKKNDVTYEKITAYIPVDPTESDKNTVSLKINDLKQFLASLSLVFSDCSTPRFSTEIIVEEDWGKTWKSFFTSFQITPGLTIKPTWEKAKGLSTGKNGNHLLIEMDPGLAFGTGHHASTQLALLLLEKLFQDNKGTMKRILDVGTGSGILAMGCARFGAKEVLAVDNDPDAIITAQENINRNRLEDIITVSDQDIASIDSRFDLIVANIIHDTLAVMAHTLSGLLDPGGHIVLSGILKGDQENSIQEIYRRHNLNFIKNLTKDEWAALQFLKA